MAGAVLGPRLCIGAPRELFQWDVFSIRISGATEQEVQHGLTTSVDNMQSPEWEINPKEIQGSAQQAQLLGAGGTL